MRHILICLTVVFSAVFTSAPAAAAWVEAKSENFIFVGDTSEKKAEKVVRELEEYRAIIFALFQVDGQTETIPVRVYGARSAGDIEEMTGNAGAGGVYTTRREGPVFILNIKGGFTDKSPAKKIALHEYTHHLISQYTNQMYPRWVNEGMAEYLSTFTISSKGDVRIGMPSESRGRTLASYEWMDWDRLTGAVRRYPYGNNNNRGTEAARWVFYAQSWLAVHYMQSTPGMSEKLSRYIQGVTRAPDQSAYFTEVFGMTPDAFGEQMRAYFKKNRFPTRRVTLKDALQTVSVTTRKLSKGEAEFHKGEGIRRFRGRQEKGRALAGEHYDKAEAAGGPMAQIAASRAVMALAAKDAAKAQTYADTARSLAPTDARVLYVSAKAAYAAYQNDMPGTQEQLDLARKRFIEALRADPYNMQTHFDYVRTYGETGDTPSKQAVASAQQATLYYRSPRFFGGNMVLARVLLEGQDKEYAGYHFRRAAAWSPNAGARNAAKRMLKNVQK